MTNGEIPLRGIGSRRYVSAQLGHDGGHRIASGLIDVTVPNAARVSDFLQGGQANFAADRKAAAALVESAPSIAAIPASARAFRRRVVRLPGRRRRDQAVPRRRPRPGAARQHPRGRAGGRPGLPDRLRRGRPDDVRPRQSDAHVRARRAGGLRRGGHRGRQRHRLGRGPVRGGLPAADCRGPAGTAIQPTARPGDGAILDPASRSRSCCCPPSPTCPRRPTPPRSWRR